MKRRPLRERVGFAVAGLREAHSRERSFRTHCRFALAALAVLIVLRPTPMWWALVAVAIGVVLAFEMINSALEGFIDLMHPGLHPEIKVVKDMSAGAVLVVSIAALVVGGALMVEAGPALMRELFGSMR